MPPSPAAAPRSNRSEGEGTILHLLLPRARSAAATAATAEAAPPGGGGALVLLVEDNDQVRDFAASLLADLDYRVVAAASAEEALEVLARDPVDILFTDVMMPGITGIELARRARQRHPRLPVLLASGYSEEIAGGAARAFETLAKPYGARTLAAALVAARARAEDPGPA